MKPPLWFKIGIAGAVLLVLGTTTYDIHRSIKSNERPPSDAQMAALAAYVEELRRASSSDPHDVKGAGRGGRH